MCKTGFGDTIIFAPVVVIRRRDLHDYPYTKAYLAYSRGPRVLAPYWQLALDGCVRPHLEVPGVPLLLHDLFVPRSEWGGTPVVASSSIPQHDHRPCQVPGGIRVTTPRPQG